MRNKIREVRMAEKLLKKCPKCRSDVFDGQRFCSSCGAEQRVPIKTSEEMQRMRDLLKELCVKPSGERGNIPSLVFSFTAFLAADTALKWAMGYATDEELHKMMRIGKGERK